MNRIDIIKLFQPTVTRYTKAFMTYKTVNIEPFSIIGIAIRTTNQNGQAERDIGELWQRFFRDNITSLVSNKASEEVYCIYTDYESDANGTYTTILGYKVTTLEDIPPKLIGKTIPGSTYRVYKSTGKLPDSVVATWKEIWQTPINRRYLADFDIYGQKSQDRVNPEVETYLSVK